uniref:Stomatal closure-related actin-binding protein PH domain-containing protein n=1 Tax=Physcomitrium patens TaxID=3218 RepID=A0A7I4CH18_PHYPA
MRGVTAEVSYDRTDEGKEGLAAAREMVGKESSDLWGRVKRMSVRDLASKFESGQAAAQAAAARLAEEQKAKEVALLDKPALLKKLRGLLGDLLGRVAGRNKDDVTEALITVDAVEAQWTQRETEAMQERGESRKLAALFQKELVELRQEIKEARRITMLHAPSKVMDMEYEIAGLRQQLTEKALEVVALRKKVDALVSNSEGPSHFELQGEERLGSSLVIVPADSLSPELGKCKFQWHRMHGIKAETIIGATRPQYAPEPLDVGKKLKVDIDLPDGSRESLATSGPIDGAAGLGQCVEALVRKGGAEFNVRIFQENGEHVVKATFQVLVIDKSRMKLFKGRHNRAKEEYSSSMQLCGARGGGDAAARSLYWVANKSLTFMLVLDSERERNAAIMLARRFAYDCNVILGGPDD